MFLLLVVAAVRVAIAADVTRGGDEEAAADGPLLRQTVGPTMTPIDDDGGHPPGGAAQHSCNCSPPKAHWNAGTGHIGPVLAVADVASCAAKCCAEHRCAAYAFRIAPDDDNAAITAAAPLNSPRGNCWLKDNNADGHVDASRASAACRSPQPAPPPPSPGPPNPPIAAVSVEVSSTGVYWHTDRRFKSWNIDASPNRGWEVRNLSQPKLHYLAAASLPGYLRFGGSGNDGLVYGVGNNVSACAPSATHCLNETHFRDFMSFTQASTAKLIFGLNIDPRTTTNEWDPTQARALMTYGRQHFGDDAFFAFELGNEQDKSYTAQQCAKDFSILYGVINQVWADLEPAARPKLIGPDPHGFHSAPMDAADAKKLEYLRDFALYAKALHIPMFALTHHEYVEVAEYSTHPPEAYVLDRVGGIAAQVNASLRTEGTTATMIFAGETGPHNGKSPGVLSDQSMRWANFANTFWYLDAMASKAKFGYSAFCRQDFIGIDYGMLNPETNDPLPDFFAGILWSRLMGTGVVHVTVAGEATSNATVRAYAHCTPEAPNSAFGSGDLTILLLNLASNQTKATTVTISGVQGCDATNCSRTEWRLSGPNGTDSPTIALNGVELSLEAGRVPALSGKQVLPPYATTQVQLPGSTVAFLRFEGAGRVLGCGAASTVVL